MFYDKHRVSARSEVMGSDEFKLINRFHGIDGFVLFFFSELQTRGGVLRTRSGDTTTMMVQERRMKRKMKRRTRRKGRSEAFAMLSRKVNVSVELDASFLTMKR